jgi:antitoxin component YwqK of YwqJK toxin-antitoxin module
VEGIMQAYQNVDKIQAEAYVKNMLQNETVIEFLESKMK